MNQVNVHNWMGSLDGSLKLNQITIPGTHNSATQHCALPRLARCQHTSIAEQLSNGFRFLDIRLLCKGRELFLVHAQANCKTADGRSNLPFSDVLEMCYAFLRANPTETILMSIKKDRGYHQDKFAEILLEEYFSHMPDRWYLKNQTPELNTARGKIVLLRRYRVKDYEKFTDETSGLNFSVWPDQKSRSRTHAVAFDMETTDRSETGRLIHVQDRYALPPAVKWLKSAMPMLQQPCAPDQWYLNFLSTMNGGPEQSAAEMNGMFHAHPLEPGCHGVISCDYGTVDLAKKIIDTNFK